MRHCPNCDCEVIVWDDELQADKCVDCGESWALEEQEPVMEGTSTITIGEMVEWLEERYPR
jgi:hypothetical protein